MGFLVLEVGGHPFLKIDGFADIDDFPAGSFHQVNAGTIGNGADDSGQVV